MDRMKNLDDIISVPFSKTRCGVNFYINTGSSSDVCGVLTEHKRFKTDFFNFYFIHKANGFLLLDFRKIPLQDNIILLLSPHQQQEWHVDESQMQYNFLIFREDFMRTFLADKFFVYRLLYCYQTDTLPTLIASQEEQSVYNRLLGLIKQELQHPSADSYNIIVSLLYYLLLLMNRNYARFYNLPVDIARNNYAFRFKELLERHVRDVQRVEEYARMLGISRVTLNDAVKSQFGVSASHLMKQRLLEDLKNELLFSDNNISQLADDFRFSDPSHLMRFFKQHTGKTLLQYKQDYMNGIYE